MQTRRESPLEAGEREHVQDVPVSRAGTQRDVPQAQPDAHPVRAATGVSSWPL